MLAPASLRPGSSPGEADRRRTLRLVVVAVIAAVLAVVIPLALAALADRDDAAAPAPALTGADPSAVSVPPDGVAIGAGPATVDDVPSSAPSSAVAPSSAPEPAPAPASGPASADTDPSTSESSSAAIGPANWMEALRPQVDPEGLATWVFEARGAWGASDGHTVFIDPNVPEDKRWSVMVHEYGHVLQVRHYGSLNATAVAMNAVVGAGPTDKGPTESNADCIAELLGATWTDYGCQDALRPAAAALVVDDQSRIGAAQAARP